MHNNNNTYLTQNTTTSARQILRTLFKRKKLIFTSFLLVTGVVTIASFIMTPVYRASAKLIVEREVDSEKALLFRMDLNGGVESYDWIIAETEIMKSNPIASRIIKDLDLKSSENPSEYIQPHDFINTLGINHAQRTNVIQVSFDDADPDLAKKIVDKVVESYQQYRRELYTETGEYQFFENQIKIAEEKLSSLEKRQSEFKKDQKVISPEAQRQILVSRLADYERTLTAIQTKRIGKEAKVNVIDEQLASGKDVDIPVTEASDSPSREKHIAKLRGELLDFEMQREQLLEHFTPEYEDIKSLDRQIATTKEKIKNEIKQIVSAEKTAIRSLKAEEQLHENMIAKINTEIQDFAQTEYQYSKFNRGIDDNREIYSMLLKQREDARISLAKLQDGIKIKVIGPAVVTPKPIRPRKQLNILIGMFLGLFLGFFLTFVIEYFDHTVNTPEELEKLTDLNFIGSVREMNSKANTTRQYNNKQTFQTINN